MGASATQALEVRMLALEMLPAQDGDCLLLEYGALETPHRILIDAGRPETFEHLKARIEALPRANRHFELFIVTHIDEDHIAGAIDLLEARESLGVTFGEVWFNGWQHLESVSRADDKLGGVAGERLTELLVEQRLPWNRRFASGAVVVPDTGPLPVHAFQGLTLTVLTPSAKRLEQLMPEWEEAVIEAGLVPGRATARQLSAEDDRLGDPSFEALLEVPFEGDSSKPNASSISVLAEYQGCRLLLGADAYPQDLLAALQRHAAPTQRLALHAFKIPHHGSRKNIHVKLLQKLSCTRFLVSTNGSRHKHPNREAIARVIQHGRATEERVELFFNYETEFNKVWRNPGWMREHRYTAHFPPEGQQGLRMVLMP
ncbi:hypothetical protein D7V77_06445 [Corallococcus sp. CA041A]|nr:hypothetical protein D7V77_06445 [Corallococcus sp. CA041A]RKI01876.1 hypothetical protein D7Y04_15395 [Corallococcus sp. AB038B]